METPISARLALEAWKAAHPANYGTEPHLAALNVAYCDDNPSKKEWLSHEADLFGASIVPKVADLARLYTQRENEPRLELHDEFGNRVDRVILHPAHREAGRSLGKSGIVSLAKQAGRSREQATLFYLLSHEGEIGHACPIVCAIGAIRTLRRHPSFEVTHFLPFLLNADYDGAFRAAQFLTEIQGGSDVGSNAVLAELNPDGTYRITGEKWFCSVADADVFLVTARVANATDGTRGLGCFLVPRRIGGALNGFTIRRLKDKIGTRSLATAEIEFNQAVAYPIGALSEGFKIAVSDLLNTSRWLNAVANAGIMHRAYLEALFYAKSRYAFGKTIASFPPILEKLAHLKAEWISALYSSWLVTELDDRVDSGIATKNERRFHRILVNANKYLVSMKCTESVKTT